MNQTAVANHADQTPRRVRAAAESEHINFVALLIFFGEKLVALDDIEFQPGADGSAQEAIVPFAPDSFVVPFDLLDSVRGPTSFTDS